MSEDATPLGPDDLDALEIPVLGPGAGRLLVLAVSGGVDSMCLMHIAAELAPRHEGTRLEVVTVDHGLRPESAEEARFVAAEAAKLGLSHTTKVWAGDKPATGIQAAAREARYRLINEAREAFSFHGNKVVLAAHTKDDQAETVLMRLARGSGIDGLSGMSPFEFMSMPPTDTEFADAARKGVCPRPAMFPLARPFLDIPKSRLIATMRARGLPWREDPSNAEPAFERVRIRRLMSQLAECGIGAEAITRSARRIASARDVVVGATMRVLNDERLVRVDPAGFVAIDRSVWGNDGHSGAVGVRVLAAAVRVVGAMQRPISLQALEDLADKLARGWTEPGLAGVGTLGLCRVLRSADKVLVVREEGRLPPSPLRLEPGDEGVFDRRFMCRLSRDAAHPYEVRSLGAEGLKILRDRNACPPEVPAQALRMFPAFWTDTGLAAVPCWTISAGFAPIGADCWFLGSPSWMETIGLTD